MVDSLQTSAQLTQVVEVDVTNVARLRESVKDDFLAREGVKLTYLPFFAKAAIDALKEHPKLNATIDTEAGEITYYDRENLAFAVDTEKGLITPVVRDAGDLSVAGLAKKIADVAERTRTNKIGPTSSPAAPSRSPTSAAWARCSTPRSSTSRRWRSSGRARSSSGRW